MTPAEWVRTFGQKLVLRHVESLNGESYDHDGPRVRTEDIDEANVATSTSPVQPTSKPLSWSDILEGEPIHRPVIDIDLPVYLFDSTTPGHHHLVIDKEVTFTQLLNLLRAMADIGIVEPGYVAATERRGYSSMRLPWVRKGTPGEVSS